MLRAAARLLARPSASKPSRRPRSRLAVETMEQRVVPAYNLSVSGDLGATAHVFKDTFTPGTTVFTPTATGAVLNTTDISAALAQGNVVITTGSGGTEAGNITWDQVGSSIYENIGYNGSALHTLTIRPDASSTVGNVTLDGPTLTFNDNVDVVVDTTAPAAAGNISWNAQVENAHSFTLNAGAGNVTRLEAMPNPLTIGFINYQIATVSGDVALSAAHVSVAGTAIVSSAKGGVTVNAPVDLGVGQLIAVAPAGTVTLNGPVDGAGNLALAGQTNAVNAPIGRATALGTLTLGGTWTDFGPAAGSVAAGAIKLQTGVTAAGDLTFAGPVTLTGSSGVSGTGPTALTFAGTIDGGQSLYLDAAAIHFEQAVGRTTALNYLGLDGGAVSFDSTIKATTITLGGDYYHPAVLGAGSGTVTGTVWVDAYGILNPGGVGTPGTLNIAGDLNFYGGTYDPDLGMTPDLVRVTGNVNLSGDSYYGYLGGTRGTGLLAGPAKVLDYTGTLSGSFNNAPVGHGVIVGTDAAQVTQYGPPGTGVTVAPLAALPGGVMTGADADGTGYAVKLTGGGDLVGFTDTYGRPELVVRNATPASKLTVATRANASDNKVYVDGVVVNGPLAAFTAPTVDVGDELRATGPVKAIVAHNLTGATQIGGAAGGATTIHAHALGGSLTTPGTLPVVSVATDLYGTLTAGAVGSLTAGTVDYLNLTARSLGSLKVTGTADQAGSVFYSTFALTGDDGSAGHYGIKSVSVAGNVQGSTFNVEAGNVGSFTAGRFLSSNLYLDYAPNGPFNAGGAFGTANHYKVGKFTVTAATVGDPNNAYNYAFQNSTVAADSFGTVKLSGVKTDNGGTAFGFKSRTAVGSVSVASSDASSLAGRKSEAPAAGALAGDFYLLDV